MATKKRRDYGSGSIYQRSDGRWVGSIEAGYTTRGSRRRITVTAKTEAAAKRRLRDKLRELEDGVVTGVNPRATVKQWSEQWLPIAERDLRPKSYSATQSAIRQWIVPTIGHRRLSELTPADVRKVNEAQRAEGRTEGTRRRTHSNLMTLLKAARAEGHAVPQRVTEVRAPKKGVSDRAAIPAGDAVRLLEEASKDPAGSRWVAALLQGMRQGECLGLTREAVDLERGTLILSWQLQPLPYKRLRDPSSGFRVPDGYEARQVRGRLHLVRPKSEAGWRVIPLVPWMKAALATWLAAMPDSPHGLLWYHPKGDPARLDDAAWYELQDAAQVRHPTRLTDGGEAAYYTIHEARHATATLLLEAGVDVTVIKAIMGHSSIVTSQGYMHAHTEPMADALSKVAERLALG